MTHVFDEFQVDEDRRELRRDAQVVVIEPKVFDLLVHLIENREHVVSKDDLVAAVWQGRFISDAAIASALSALRRAIGDDGKEQRYIKTVRGRGFRFVGDVTQPARAAPSRPAANTGSQPSIAILPFANASEEPAQDYLADGICDDITTAIGRIGWLLVIARTSSVSFRDNAQDPATVARELNVRYLLYGKVQQAGGRIRMSVRLLEAMTSRQVWAENYDRALEDVFAMQDDIAANVVSALEPQLSAAEIRRALATSEQDLDAWDCVIRALSLQSKFTRETSEEALALLRRALEIDPGYARAWSQIAWTLAWRIHQGWETAEASLPVAIEAAENAVKFDADEPWAYIAWLFIATITRDAELLLNSPRRALEINPNFAMAHSWMGASLALTGHGEDALEWIERARVLSPRDIFKHEFDVHESYAHFQTGNYAAAVSAAQRAVMPRPDHVYPRLVMASALGHLGDRKAGASQVARIHALAPDATLASVRTSCVFINDDDIARFVEGLKLSVL